MAYIGEKIVAYKVMVGKPERRNHLKDPGIDGRIILKWIFKKWDRIWTDLSQDRDMWRALLDAAMNLRVA